MVIEGLVTKRLQKNLEHDGYRRTENKLAVTYFRIDLTICLGKLCKPTKHVTYDSRLFT